MRTKPLRIVLTALATNAEGAFELYIQRDAGKGGKMVRLLCAVAIALTLASCGGGGSKSTTSVENTTVSKGQQLMDLKRALDEGAISQSAYNAQRQKILASP